MSVASYSRITIQCGDNLHQVIELVARPEWILSDALSLSTRIVNDTIAALSRRVLCLLLLMHSLIFPDTICMPLVCGRGSRSVTVIFIHTCDGQRDYYVKEAEKKWDTVNLRFKVHG